MYRISPHVKHGGDADYTVYRLANEVGALARTTSGDVFRTGDIAFARAAMAYLNQASSPVQPRTGSHRLKSLFGR